MDGAAAFADTSPATGRKLPAVSATPVEHITDVVSRARRAQAAWAALDLEKRVKAVAGVRSRILSRAEEIAKLVHDEVGKPEVEALLGEVLASADVASYWAGSIGEALEPFEAEIDPLAYPKKLGWVHRDARGIIGLIMP